MDTLEREALYSHYQYEIWSYPDENNTDTKYYYYKILDKGGEQHFWLNDPVIRESDEDFNSVGEASLAAIGHIGLLEDGEG